MTVEPCIVTGVVLDNHARLGLETFLRISSQAALSASVGSLSTGCELIGGGSTASGWIGAGRGWSASPNGVSDIPPPVP